MKKLILISLLLLSYSAWAQVHRNVKAAGGGDCTVIQTCVNLMSPGDTTTVWAGTYNENVTVSAGGVGLYKTINVNGSDVVSVLSFTLGSHVMLIGNCPEKQGTVTTATCGFFIANPSSPGNAPCISFGTSTDVYVVHNNMYACAGGLGSGSNTGGPAVSSSTGASFLYILGNTISYPAATVGSPVFTGIGMLIKADHCLVENNDFSHYTLGVKYESNSFCMFRNNSFHDQLESEGSSNAHTDIFFSEPGIAVTTQHEVMEGNYERNAVGPNAKGPLEQNESCGGLCDNIIFRFNTISRTGSGAITNDKSWPNVKVYNNTFVDEGQESHFNTPGGGGDNMQSTGVAQGVKNNIWFSSLNFNSWNPYMCNGCANPNYGHNLAWCTGTCTIFGHTYQSGAFTADPGNINVDPKFTNYVSAGNINNNFQLLAGSPAIAAGTFLTTANGSGTGSTSLVVTDATYFQDGFGLSNIFTTVFGDCIKVTSTSNAPVCITSVNYATNTLTLASPISWTTGDSIWLYSKSDNVVVLTGSTSDMGAFPFSSTPPPAPPHGLTVLEIGN